MIKILHTADLHLGYRQYGFALREGDFYQAAQQVFQKAIAEKVDAILLAGDVFDAAKPPAIAVWVMRELVNMATQAGITVLGIDGNHDMAEGHWLKICGITPIGRGYVHDIHKDGITLRIAGIDACRATEFYRQVQVLNLEGERIPIQILAIHQAVAELCDFAVSDFNALQMATAIKPMGIQYVAMGDIHTYRETVIGGIRFAYSGSTEVNAIDESTDKSCSLVTWDGAKLATAMLPLQTRPFKVCRLESDADVDALLAMVAQQPAPFIIGWYSMDKRDLGKRAESLLRESGAMYRIMPYAGEQNVKQMTKTFERKGAMLQLKDAVTAFFEEGSDEFQLVFQLLGSPDNTKAILQAYMKSKGL